MKNNVKQWFVYNHAVVSGPFSSEEIFASISEHRFRPDDLIWAKGQREWMPVESWQMPQEAEAEPQWYISEDGNTLGPITFDEIVHRIKTKEFSSSALLWMPDMQDWASVYQVPTLMEALNISRRKHMRAPLAAKVEITNPELKESTDALTLSMGGLSFRNLKDLSLGQVVSLRICSPVLGGVIYAKARVVYTEGRQTGLEFIHISDENKVAVFEYVKQFESGNLSL
jgi:hypothetical protein